jgi:hypothetical protein
VQFSTLSRLSDDDFWSGELDEADEAAGQSVVATSRIYAVASGDPNGVVTAARAAILYSDLGALWVKTGAGTSNTGWAAILSDGSVGASGAAAVGVTIYAIASGDPNGVVTATRPAILYSDLGAVWIKTGVGSSNTGWVALASDGSVGASGAAVTGATIYAIASGDPNGVTTAMRAAILYSDVPAFWFKTGAGSSNTGWYQVW